jgi:hypothetical protein
MLPILLLIVGCLSQRIRDSITKPLQPMRLCFAFIGKLTMRLCFMFSRRLQVQTAHHPEKILHVKGRVVEVLKL